MFTACPACDAPAEVTDSVGVSTTTGPDFVITIVGACGHWFRGLSASLVSPSSLSELPEQA